MDLDDDEAADCPEYVRCLDGDQTNFLLDNLYEATSDKKKRENQNQYFWYALVYTDLWTGLRRGELLALRWSDTDFSKRTLSVRRSLAYTKEKGIFPKKPKNKKSARTIEITPETIEVIEGIQKRAN